MANSTLIVKLTTLQSHCLFIYDVKLALQIGYGDTLTDNSENCGLQKTWKPVFLERLGRVTSIKWQCLSEAQKLFIYLD